MRIKVLILLLLEYGLGYAVTVGVMAAQGES